MARINVEDELFADFRFQDLCSTLGDIEKALGKMVRLWIVAQKYWVDNQALIPFQVFEKGPWQACLNAGLVEKKDTGYYVCGSEKQFSWLVKASEAGKKSAKNRQEKYGSSQPIIEGPSNHLRTTLEGRLKVSEPLTPTPTPTLKKEKNIPPSADAFGEVLSKLSLRWLEFAQKQSPASSKSATWTHDHFAVEIEKIRKKIQVDPDRMVRIFDFIEGNDFWMKAAVSPFGLLNKGKNGLLKIETILNQIPAEVRRINDYKLMTAEDFL